MLDDMQFDELAALLEAAEELTDAVQALGPEDPFPPVGSEPV